MLECASFQSGSIFEMVPFSGKLMPVHFCDQTLSNQRGLFPQPNSSLSTEKKYMPINTFQHQFWEKQKVKKYETREKKAVILAKTLTGIKAMELCMWGKVQQP